MERLNVCLSSLKAVKDGHVSRTRVSAVSEAALRALRHGTTAGEIAEALILHAISSSKEQRLAALYALHETVWTEKKQLEGKNANHRTEKRGSLSIALETKVEQVFALFKEAPSKDREQVGKILHKWSERFVFPSELCRRCARLADCAIPPEPTTVSPRKDAPAPPLPAATSTTTSLLPTTTITTGGVVPVSLSIKPTMTTTITTSSTTATLQPITIGGYNGGGSGLQTTTTTGGVLSSSISTKPPVKSGWSNYKKEDSSSSGANNNNRSHHHSNSRDQQQRSSSSRARSPDDRREKRSRWDQG